jgi:hypothetical protein
VFDAVSVIGSLRYDSSRLAHFENVFLPKLGDLIGSDNNMQRNRFQGMQYFAVKSIGIILTLQWLVLSSWDTKVIISK